MIQSRSSEDSRMNMPDSVLHSLKKCQDGFTLIELLVVVAILSILSGFAMLNMNFDNRSKQMQEHTEKIAALMQLASDEAIYLNKELGIRFSPEDFVFYQLNKVKKSVTQKKPAQASAKAKKIKSFWQPLTEDRRLRRRTLLSDIELILEISGVEVIVDEPSKDDIQGRKVKPQILILSNGELVPDFRITLIDTQSDDRYIIASGKRVPIIIERPE